MAVKIGRYKWTEHFARIGKKRREYRVCLENMKGGKCRFFL